MVTFAHTKRIILVTFAIARTVMIIFTTTKNKNNNASYICNSKNSNDHIYKKTRIIMLVTFAMARTVMVYLY